MSVTAHLMPEKREIERTCIGCRVRKPKGELVRYILDPSGQVVEDTDKTLPGRGAYLCGSTECLQKALKKGAFSRAFKESAKWSGIAVSDNG